MIVGYDIRGEFEKDLTLDFILNLGKKLARKNKSYFIARDIRESGKLIQSVLSASLLSRGIKLYSSGEMHIGMAFFSAKILKTPLIYITASHLPSNWNGIKFYYPNGDPFSNKELKEIIEGKEVNKLEYGKEEVVDLSEEYVGFFDQFDVNIKPLIDFRNGTTALYGKDIWDRISKADFLNSNPDPELKTNPEPKKENLKELSKKVKNYDIGIAYDGDGDRVVFMNKEGEIIHPELIAILYLELAGIKKPKIVANIACSDILEEYGKVKWIPVGHTYLLWESKNADIGLERANHMVIPKYLPFDDGVLISAIISSLLDKNIDYYLKDLPKIKIWEEKVKFKGNFEKLIEKIEKEFGKGIEIDGLRINTDKGWFLIRKSNTEPNIIRIYIEEKKEGFIKETKKFLKKFI